MPGIGGSLKLLLLFTAYAKLPPNSLDPANAYSDTVLRQIMLQLLGAANLPGPLMRRSNLDLKPRFLPGPLG
jgi:hypothetical protein